MKRAIVLGLLYGLYGPLWGFSAEYSLRLSEAQNAYESRKIDRCVHLSKRLIRDHPHPAGAYFLLGRVHLEKEYYRIAVMYFGLAAKHQEGFLIPEKKTDLYLHLSAAYYYLQNRPKQVESLHRMKTLAETELKSERTLHYQKALGEASFALGLLHYKDGDFYKAKPYLLSSVENGFYEKVSGLLLAYYYCSRPQDDINAALKRAYKKVLRTENRDVFFKFYYDRYKKAAVSRIETALMNESWYRKMITEVEFTASGRTLSLK